VFNLFTLRINCRFFASSMYRFQGSCASNEDPAPKAPEYNNTTIILCQDFGGNILTLDVEKSNICDTDPLRRRGATQCTYCSEIKVLHF